MSQFYFAWTTYASDNTFSPAFKRWDEEIFDFKLSHAEGDFASLEITIINPRIGLLAPGRDLWAWFAFEHPTLGTVPLFFGRLVALPTDLTLDTVKLTFIARPEDFDARKRALAETLKVRPYWDSIWFAPETVDDPDNVLESRPAHWHIDRVSHAVTISQVNEGEDGNIVLTTADVFADSVKVSYEAPPVRAVQMSATVTWDQKAAGLLALTDEVKRAFGGSVATFTGEGFQKGFPEAGKSFGGGWAIGDAACTPVAYVAPQITFQPGWEVLPKVRATMTPFEDFQYDDFFLPHGGLRFVKTYFDVNVSFSYDVSRQKKELLTFELEADVQSIVTDPAGQDVIALNMSSSEITQPVDPGGALPLADQASRAYFTTDRGSQSIEYLLAVARARLLARARCVRIGVEVPFNDGIAAELNCRKNVVFTDPRLPGGIATGKIIEYSFTLDGDTGSSTCEITIGSTPGHGAEVVAVAGSPDYVEDDYVEADYQQHVGAYLLPDFGDLIYAPIAGDPPNDDGVDFNRLAPDMVVEAITVQNTADDQEAAMPFHGPVDASHPLGMWSQFYLANSDSFPILGFRPDYSPTDAIGALNAMKTTLTIRMKSLTGGPFETDYALAVSPVMVPKLIDLEASS